MKGSSVMAKKTKLDLKSLRVVFEAVNDNKSKLALSLLDKAEFMEKCLKDLQKKVEEDGVVTSMCQGNYDIDRANPALQAYNVTIKNYNSVIKQISDLLPATSNKADGESLLDFIASGKK